MGYGPYVVIVPALEDSDLVYTEDETRQIFNFFYPDWSAKIADAQIDNVGRAIAQTMVIAAVEGTYAMSYIKATMDVLMGNARKPSREILSLVKKLGKKFVKNWWHHVKKGDLDDPKVYYAVQVDIAGSFKDLAYDYIYGIRALSSNFQQKGFRGHFFG